MSVTKNSGYSSGPGGKVSCENRLNLCLNLFQAYFFRHIYGQHFVSGQTFFSTILTNAPHAPGQLHSMTLTNHKLDLSVIFATVCLFV